MSLKEIISLLESKDVNTLTSKRGNVYKYKIVDNKVINELKKFKSVNISRHEVNLKELLCISIFYKKEYYHYYLIVE